MTAQSTVLKYEAIKSLNTATLAGAYLPIGAPTTHEVTIAEILNDSTVGVFISTDGGTDMDFVRANTDRQYAAGTNRGAASPSLSFPRGTQFYAKAAAGVGFVHIAILYGDLSAQTAPL